MAINKVMTPRKLVMNLVGEANGFNNHEMDEEIKICMMSPWDDKCHVDFRITEVDENSIYIRPKGITSDKKRFTAKLPKDKWWVNYNKKLLKEIKEEKNNGHQ